MKKRLTKLMSVFLVLVMLFANIAMLVTNTSAYTYIAQGIDVSAWQGNITWPSVKASGVDFAVLRIMAYGKDKYFEQNYTNAKAAGVKLGVYCYSYATTVAGAQAEATKVLNWLGGRTLEYPVYYDIEDSCQASLTTAQRTQLCIAFCDTIQAGGYRAGIYSGAAWFNSKLDRATLAAKYEIWEAMWPTSNGVQVNSPIYDRSARCSVWQYSSTGSVPGISGRVDMNVSYKDYASYMVENGYNGYGSGGVKPVTPTTCAPANYGWKWPASEAYGYMGNYGGNGQDIELSVDLCLLPSSAESKAVFYTNGTSKQMSITQTQVTVGSKTASFNWGALSLDNWHDVKFKIYNGYGYVFIDGKLVAFDNDITANTDYQLLFCYTGEMAIDNAVMMSSEGTTYFNCDFEDATASQKLMGDGLGKRTQLFAVTPVTDNSCAPSGSGWRWPASDAYGYIGNYGGNGQDIELCVDLCLLPSSAESKAVFYTNGTSKQMSVTQTQVTVGSKTVSYNWGTLGLDNWHDVKFKIYNGNGYLFIDGELIASDSGMTANTDYQLLFCYTGEMAIDNAILMSSTGDAYVSCDFENGSQSQTLMGDGLGSRVLLFDIATVTPDTVAPAKHVWQWNEEVAYGYMGNYGGNGQDIELCVDLCLLPSSTDSKATFYTDGTSKNMNITATAVTVGSTTVAYNWGSLGLDNWHDVKFKILNGTGYVFIDGDLIASEAGFTANEDYQLLFSYPGEMAIDNAVLMSSTGTTYFSCDFEDASAAQTLMGEGLGSRVKAFADTSSFNVAISPASKDITGKGSVTFTATPSAGEGHTYSWSCSDSTLENYMSTNGNKCTINVTDDLSSALSANIKCTVTSDGGVTNSNSVTVKYAPYPVPVINSITPSTASITGTGSATYKVTATGDGLTYKWSSTNVALNSYLAGATTDTLTVNIPEELAGSITATLTCTVTNSYGKTVATSAGFTYTAIPVPVITGITPESGAIKDTGSISYTAKVTGEGLTYQWTTDSEELLALLSGTDTATVTVDIANKLSASFDAELTCTVTNGYGKSDTKTVSFSYTATDDGEIEVPMLGDINGDGKFNAMDINTIKRILNGSMGATAAQKQAADLNGDGMINAIDVNVMIRLILAGN